MQRGNQLDSERRRIKREAVVEKNPYSVAAPAGIGAGGWREIGCLKANAGNLSLVQEGEQRRRGRREKSVLRGSSGRRTRRRMA